VNERDELISHLGDVLPVSDERIAQAADWLLDAGYRKLRTITTAEELEELPGDTVLRDKHDQIAVIRKGELGGTPYLEVEYAGTHEIDSHYRYIDLPALVLYTPEGRR